MVSILFFAKKIEFEISYNKLHTMCFIWKGGLDKDAVTKHEQMVKKMKKLIVDQTSVDFGTIAVYSCINCCCNEGKCAYVDEYVWVQPAIS